MIVLLGLLAAGAATGNEVHTCTMPGGDLVPSARVAQEVAEAILRGRQSAEERSHFEIRVEPAGNDAWDVVEIIPDRIEPNGSVTHTDGGGLAIRIDRCNGAIIFFQYLI